ncbi:hypothetical protein lerEdw1_014517 [Lerista edwardsae]|nr:hypothetical protein lerEdw1_014517 [Lerista edwardsae]
MASGDPLVRSVQGVLAMVQGFYGTLFGWTEGCSPRVLRTFQATDDSDARNRQIASRRLSESQAASLVQAITDNEPAGRRDEAPRLRDAVQRSARTPHEPLLGAPAGGVHGGGTGALAGPAFDRVDRTYLWTTLRARGMPAAYLRNLQCLYERASAVPVVQGWPRAPVPLASGLRQGCPLSPLLYVLALDPLLRTIQADERIEGLVTRSGRRLKALAHADVMYVNPKERLWQS